MHAPFSFLHTESPGYGWTMIGGVILSIFFWVRLAKRDERLFFIYICALLGAFFGAKIVYVFAEGWLHFGAKDMWVQLATGKSILGALLGGYAGVELAKRYVNYPGSTGDWFALIVPLGVAIGRVGCLLHGCCLGEVCAPHWFTISDAHGIARWPSVPVELGFNLLIAIAFLLMRKRRILIGQHFHIYLIAYGTFRFIHEFYRATPKILPPFSGYQIASLAVAMLGVWGFLKHRKKAELHSSLTANALRVHN